MAKKAIRPIRIEGNIAYVPLTQGYEAVIDAADVPLVDGVNWCAAVDNKNVYAVRSVRNQGKQRQVRMHRVISSAPDDLDVDHRDGNGLNNRRETLRAATQSQNAQNQRISAANTSGVKGVYWNAVDRKWMARVAEGKKRHFVGLFDSLEDAAAAVAKKRTELHGEFARAA